MANTNMQLGEWLIKQGSNGDIVVQNQDGSGVVVKSGSDDIVTHIFHWFLSDALSTTSVGDDNYENECVNCAGLFIGKKRETRCSACKPTSVGEGVPASWRESLQEMVAAMRAYEMDVGEPAPHKHRHMMEKADALLAAPPASASVGEGVPVADERELRG